jgi:hypothetical protein
MVGKDGHPVIERVITAVRMGFHQNWMSVRSCTSVWNSRRGRRRKQQEQQQIDEHFGCQTDMQSIR